MIVTQSPDLQTELLQSVRYEIYRWMHLPQGNWRCKVLNCLLQNVLTRTVQKGMTFDLDIQQYGLCQASRKFLANFVETIEVTGADALPQKAPLLIICNHPGAMDVLSVAAQVNRNDLKMIARDMRLLRLLPGLHGCMIYSTPEIGQRASILREGVRHLMDGGALLLCASGKMDPDPAWTTDCLNQLSLWNPSPALFMQKVPEIQGTIAISSRVIGKEWRRSPWVKMQKTDWDRQFIAELIQTLFQVNWAGRYRQSPKVTFSPVFSSKDLTWEKQTIQNLHEGILGIARQQLINHIACSHLL